MAAGLDNGKENGNYSNYEDYIGDYRDYIGDCRDYIGIVG